MSPEPSAQALYRTWIRDELGPALRRLGFKGSSGRYTLPDDAAWAFLSLQGSKWNTLAEVVFTVNLKVVDKTAWQVDHDRRPDPSAHDIDFDAESLTRLSSSVPGQTYPQGWWAIRAPEDLEPVLDDLLSAVSESGLPWLRKEIRNLTGAGPSGPAGDLPG